MFDFLSIKKSVEAISKEYRTLKSELDAVRAEIPSIDRAPTNKKDICELAVNWVEKSKSSFAPALVDFMRNVFVDGGAVPFDFGIFSAMKNESGNVTVGAMDQAMCSLFPAEVTRALCDAINKMDWPNEGLPRAERAAKLA